MFATLACGQEASESIFRSDTRLVVVHVTVTDKDGQLVRGLPQSAFRVSENDKPQEIKVFRQEDAPVSIGLIIDNSASMTSKRGRVEAAALALVKASNPDDESFVINFNDRVFLDQGMTSDIKELQTGLRRIESRGETAMRDAIHLGIKYLGQHATKEKKMLFVLTDGDDNASNATLQQIVREAQDSGVIVYAVGLLSEETPREVKNAHEALDTLTASTGGQAFYPETVDEIDRIVQKVASDVRNQYTVAYNPTNQALDGTFRRISVTVSDPRASLVRYRSGYFAEAANTTSNTPPTP